MLRTGLQGMRGRRRSREIIILVGENTCLYVCDRGVPSQPSNDFPGLYQGSTATRIRIESTQSSKQGKKKITWCAKARAQRRVQKKEGFAS